MASFETIQTNSIVYHTLITFISFTVLFGGIFGNTANILVLTRLKLFRNNSATFYLVTESIVNVFQMLIPFTSRIAINSFDSDLTKTSLVWCKFRQVFSQIVALMTLSIICFASFDQFLSTSHYPYLRQSSTVRLARITVSSAALLSFIQAIPFVIYFEIRPLLGCSVYDAGIVIYTTYGYYFLLSGILPIFWSISISKCSTYRSSANGNTTEKTRSTIDSDDFSSCSFFYSNIYAICCRTNLYSRFYENATECNQYCTCTNCQ